MNQIPIIDVFAGPGGLAEGFSSLALDGRRPFRVVLSIEKDKLAHETLTLRGFYRQFEDGPPNEYWQHLRGQLLRSELYAHFPQEFRRAQMECVCHELGEATADTTHKLVRNALAGHTGAWGLIGGPPCQAYSLVGRSRNRGIANYIPEEDHRQTLYVEYLQILADHRPAFFVMENVKGLLSATLETEKLFERILSDLQDPAVALRREGRKVRGGRPRYSVHAVTRPSSGLFGPAARDAVVRAEEYGIPQARHRVILVGILEGVDASRLTLLNRHKPRSVGETIDDLPKLRSGLTDRPDSPDEWLRVLRRMKAHRWVKASGKEFARELDAAVAQAESLSAGRGAEWVPTRKRARGGELCGVLNHATRAHISGDLERYMFAACFARVHFRSPVLSDFPRELLPHHRNARAANRDTQFADRFRVQLEPKPSTTITSHIAKDGHYYIHYDPSQCRSLTVREAARLQTFPDDYLFCGPRTSQYHQVGNAVPPALARQIAAAVHRLA